MKSKSGTDSLKLKKYEELYSLSWDGIKEQQTRFDLIETKVYRHMSLLLLILGFTGIGLKEVIRLANDACRSGTITFFIAYVLLTFFTVTAIYYYVKAFKFQSLESLVFNKSLLARFQKDRYIDIIFAISRGNISTIRKNNVKIKAKALLADKGYKAMRIALVFALITILLYVVVLVID